MDMFIGVCLQTLGPGESFVSVFHRYSTKKFQISRKTLQSGLCLIAGRNIIKCGPGE